MTFVKGQSGNPAGRPPGSKNFTTKVKEALEKIADGKDYSYEEALVKAVLKKAIVDQDVTMMRLIWNYLDGMPAQSGDLNLRGLLKLEFSKDFAQKPDDADTPSQTEGDNSEQGSVEDHPSGEEGR